MGKASLYHDQTRFRDALFSSESCAPEELITPEETNADHRFKVYRNNVTHSLTEALAQGFPAVSKLLGEAYFRQVAVDYLRKFPPRSQMMMYYGEDLAAYLGGLTALQDYPYLPDVARLELARRTAYHAADSTPIDPGRLLALDEARLLSCRLKFAPTVRLLSSEFGPLSIWKFNMENGSKPLIKQEEILVSRVDFEPVAELLPLGGINFVEALINGATFGDALLTVSENRPDFDLTQTLSLLISTNAIVEICE